MDRKMQKTDTSIPNMTGSFGTVSASTDSSDAVIRTSVYDIAGIPESRGVATIAKMLLVDDAKDYQDVINNKLWADLFVELQKGKLGYDKGLHLDTLIEGLIALCIKRSGAANDNDKRFYMDCISKFTQLLIFINTPQPLANKPYMKKEEAIRQLKSLCVQKK
jgi:hypothetical protein